MLPVLPNNSRSWRQKKLLKKNGNVFRTQSTILQKKKEKEEKSSESMNEEKKPLQKFFSSQMGSQLIDYCILPSAMGLILLYFLLAATNGTG